MNSLKYNILELNSGNWAYMKKKTDSLFEVGCQGCRNNLVDSWVQEWMKDQKMNSV